MVVALIEVIMELVQVLDVVSVVPPFMLCW